MSERIEIPLANQQNIPIFKEYPSDAIIDEIKEHIARTSSPHTWRGHSHTKPPVNGPSPFYLDDYDVPAPEGVERVAPCPCCTPFHPKYKNEGKIAWFPDEGVIRLIGPQCLAAINKRGHNEAIISLKIIKKRRATLAAITSYAKRVPALLLALSEIIPVAKQVDDFKDQFCDILRNKIKIDLWREIKDGILYTTETHQIHYTKASGDLGVRPKDIKIAFAPIHGISVADKSAPALSQKLTHVRLAVCRIEQQLMTVSDIANLSASDAEQIANTLEQAFSCAGDYLNDLRERQRFFAAESLQVLSDWSKHPNAPLRFCVEVPEGFFVISESQRYDSTPFSIPLSKRLTKPVPNFPSSD